MTDQTALLDAGREARPEPDRDRWGRYLIPDPGNGKKRAWTRATTWASTVADTFGLTKWQVRMTAVGLAQRDDLLLGVASVSDPTTSDGKKKLDRFCDQAKEHAGSSVRATLGTALHSLTEAHDLGHEPAHIPAPYDADVRAYAAALTAAGLTIDPDHIERIVCVPDLGVAGTFDRLVTLPDGRRLVADLKTGRDLSYSWTEISIQLALYAHAATIYDPAVGQHRLMPTVDLTQALVMHLPVGEATCTMYLVDIAAGWEMAEVCGTVRAWRKRKDLATRYGTSTRAYQAPPQAEQPAAEPDPERTEWIATRLKAIATNPDAKALTARHWPANTPAKPPWSVEQVEAIHVVLTEVEAQVGAPFPDSDPATTIPTNPEFDVDPPGRAPSWPLPPDLLPGVVITPEDTAALKTAARALPAGRRSLVRRWMNEAAQHDRPWTAKDGSLHTRHFAITRAAIACATHLWDDDDHQALTRAALAVLLEECEPTWLTGAVLGSLSIDQAQLLAELATKFGAGEASAAEAIGLNLTNNQETTNP